jgi:hypothetical protein
MIIEEYERLKKVLAIALPPDFTDKERCEMSIPERRSNAATRVRIAALAEGAVANEGCRRTIGGCALCLVSITIEQPSERSVQQAATCDAINALVALEPISNPTERQSTAHWEQKRQRRQCLQLLKRCFST